MSDRPRDAAFHDVVRAVRGGLDPLIWPRADRDESPYFLAHVIEIKYDGRAFRVTVEER